MVLDPSAASAASSIAMPARMSGDSTDAALERRRPGDDGAVRIAEHDPGAHADQLVHEEQPRLEHLLEHQQHAGALRRA